MGAGLGMAALTPAYGLLFAALAITGLGEGVVEGLATPLVQDLHPVESGRHLSIAHAFWPIGVLTTVLATGALLAYGISWRWITGMVAVLALIPAALLLLPVRAGGRAYPEHPEPLHWKTVRNQAAAILRIPRFWVFFAAMFLAGGGEFCLTFWSASHVQLRYGASAWAGGLGTAGFAAGMMLGRLGWGYALRQRHLKGLIVVSALGGTAVSVLLPIPSHLWLFFVLLFLAGIATAPFWPSLQSLCAERLPEVDTTMLLILLSCAGVPGCGFFTWLMGYLGNRSGDLSNAFLLVPGCYLVLALLMIGADRRPARPGPSDALPGGSP
jgi:fucose permease